MFNFTINIFPRRRSHKSASPTPPVVIGTHRAVSPATPALADVQRAAPHPVPAAAPPAAPVAPIARPVTLDRACTQACDFLHAHGVIVHGGGEDQNLLHRRGIPLRGDYRSRRNKSLFLHLATHIGCPNQEKKTNEDFVLVCPHAKCKMLNA